MAKKFSGERHDPGRRRPAKRFIVCLGDSEPDRAMCLGVYETAEQARKVARLAVKDWDSNVWVLDLRDVFRQDAFYSIDGYSAEQA